MIENGSVGAKGLRKKRHSVLVAGLVGCFVRLELTDENLFNQVSINSIMFISGLLVSYCALDND